MTNQENKMVDLVAGKLTLITKITAVSCPGTMASGKIGCSAFNSSDYLLLAITELRYYESLESSVNSDFFRVNSFLSNFTIL